MVQRVKEDISYMQEQAILEEANESPSSQGQNSNPSPP